MAFSVLIFAKCRAKASFRVKLKDFDVKKALSVYSVIDHIGRQIVVRPPVTYSAIYC